jgi:hypothetical protein
VALQHVPRDPFTTGRSSQRAREGEVTALAWEQILRPNGNGGNLLSLLLLGRNALPQRVDQRVGGMSGLEARAVRNVVIGAAANKLARISWAVARKQLLPDARHRGRFQLDEVVLKIRFSEVC